MKTALIVAAIVIGLAAGAVARFPLSLALSLSGAQGVGLDWRAAEGTVWSGHVRGVSIQDYALGDAQAALSPLSLLTFSPRVALTLTGPEAEVQAEVSFQPGSIRISNGAARLNLSDMIAIDPRLRARGGALMADGVSIRMKDGRCIAASGSLSTDALTYGFGGAWRGPALSGAVSCEDGALAMRLEGADETQQIEAIGRLGAGAFTIDAAVRSHHPDLERIAPMMGFTEYGEGWRYRWTFTQ